MPSEDSAPRKLKILVVDDTELDAKKLVEPFPLDRVVRARNLTEGVEALAAEWPDVVILDAVFPESDGAGDEGTPEFRAGDFLREMEAIAQRKPGAPLPSVLLVSGQDEAAERFHEIIDWLRQNRLRDVLPKTAANVSWKFFQGLLRHKIDRFREDWILHPSQKELKEAHEFLAKNGIITRDLRMLELHDFLTRVVRKAYARSEKHGELTSIVVEGPSGTGKELVAKALWRATDPKATFVAVNCADTETLPESKLFGHKKGSFTGAVADKEGAFESARGGFVFLDQVESLPKTVQGMLLRMLEDRRIPKLGARPKDEKTFSGKVIAACEGDLDQLRRDGAITEAFFHRLVRLKFTLPPLRERKSDIPLLVRHFLAEYESESLILADEVLAELERWDWPGNVRELRNVIYRLTLETKDGGVRIEHLRKALDRPPSAGPVTPG